MPNWTRKPQEQKGKYYFSGTFYTTSTVAETLSEEEIKAIYQDVQSFVQEQDGIDYLQVFVDDTGQKLFFIDQLSKPMIEERQKNGEYDPEHNHCTLMFSDEY